MGLFSGIKNADSTQGRNPFLTPGDYLVELKRCAGGKSRKKKNFFRVECKIHRTLKVWQDDPDLEEKARANPTLMVGEGDRPKGGTWHVNLSGEFPELGMGNVKNFVLASLEPEDEGGGWSEEEWEQKCEELIDGDGTLLDGMFLVARSENRPTRAGNPFTVTTWSPGDEIAEDLGLLAANDGGEADEPAA